MAITFDEAVKPVNEEATELYIERNGERTYLTIGEYISLRNQMTICDAKQMVQNYVSDGYAREEDAARLTDKDYFEMGCYLDHLIYSDCGDMEYRTMEHFGLFDEETEDQMKTISGYNWQSIKMGKGENADCLIGMYYSEKQAILINAVGKFIVGAVYENCVTVGSGYVFEFDTFKEAADACDNGYAPE